jgi:hypothetical protein
MVTSNIVIRYYALSASSLEIPDSCGDYYGNQCHAAANNAAEYFNELFVVP